MENWNWTKLLLIFSFIIFLGSLLLRQESAITQDLGRHLRLGEMIITGGESRKCALYLNCLTYTYPDYPFINHHWGSEVIFYLIHKAGGFPALIIFKAIVLGLAFSITLFHSLEINKGQAFLKRPGLIWLAVAISLVFFSIQMMSDRLTSRPEIFGYLFFSLVFFILSRSNVKCYITFYILPVIMLLWVNLHISFIFGLVLIWVWAGYKILNTEFRILNKKSSSAIQNSVFRIQYWKFLAIPAISTIVTIINPSDLRGAMMPLSILKDYGYTIVENMTPFFLSAFKPQPEYWIYSIFLIATIVLFLFSSAKKNPFYLLTFLTFSLFPLVAVRHLPFFALIMPPILTRLISEKFILRRKTPLRWTKLPIIVSCSLLIMALTNPVPFTYAKIPPENLTTDHPHSQAIEFVKRNNLQGPMWNNYDIGSFLEWAIPEHKTFVDGRPEAFPVGFFRQVYIPMQENKDVWNRITADYDVQWIFVTLTDSTPWFNKWWQMIQNHPDWKIIYQDDSSIIAVDNRGPNSNIVPHKNINILQILTF